MSTIKGLYGTAKAERIQNVVFLASFSQFAGERVRAILGEVVQECMRLASKAVPKMPAKWRTIHFHAEWLQWQASPPAGNAV
jgi:hypothetical protein